MTATQDNRPVRIETAFGKDVLLLVSATVSEELGRPFEIRVRLQSESENLDPGKILKTPATIALDLKNGAKRYFHGVVEKFDQLGFKREEGFCDYSALIVPDFSLLKHTSDCRVFADMTVPEIVAKVLGEHGIVPDVKLIQDPDVTFEKRRFCVQYRESTFDFVNRLLESSSIYYFFRHSESSHTMVLCNTSRSDHSAYPGYETIDYNPANQAGEFIRSWEIRNSVRSEKYVLNDYDYYEPKTSLLTDSDTTPSKFARFDYPGGYTIADGAKGKLEYANQYAKYRLQEEEWRKSIISGSGNVPGMGAGYIFKSKGPMDAVSYLAISMTLHLTLPEYSNVGAVSETMDVDCLFEAIPKDKYSYSPLRLTPKPVISGLQTAVVVGAGGWDNSKMGPYTESKIGSVYIQFRWDRYHVEGLDSSGAVNSSILVRVAQISAGNKWGSMFIPYPGNEVLVAFEEGDPDRPVIVGSLYNYLNLPPSQLPRGKYLSYINDIGGNAISFSSLKGKQSICIYANYPNDPPGSGYKENYGFTSS